MSSKGATHEINNVPPKLKKCHPQINKVPPMKLITPLSATHELHPPFGATHELESNLSVDDF
jgi:hypothetical protein